MNRNSVIPYCFIIILSTSRLYCLINETRTVFKGLRERQKKLLTRSTRLIKSANMTEYSVISKFHLVKVSHSKSSHKINIPIELARATSMDKAEVVLIVRIGENKLEVKRYDGEKDLKEYIQENKDRSN